jgi:hypothetical protein
MLSGGDSYAEEAIAAFAWPLLVQAADLVELASGRLQVHHEVAHGLSHPRGRSRNGTSATRCALTSQNITRLAGQTTACSGSLECSAPMLDGHRSGRRSAPDAKGDISRSMAELPTCALDESARRVPCRRATPPTPRCTPAGVPGPTSTPVGCWSTSPGCWCATDTPATPISWPRNMCGAGPHSLRDLKAVYDADPPGQPGARAMATTLGMALRDTYTARRQWRADASRPAVVVSAFGLRSTHTPTAT